MTERTLTSELTEKVDEKVILIGWAQTIRTHSKVTFIDLRDREGIAQAVVSDVKILEDIKNLTVESVISLSGKVTKRPASLVNPSLKSGTVEVQVDKIEVISVAKNLPIPLNDRSVDEEMRLKYRYLDLRSHKMTENLKNRHKLVHAISDRLTKMGFTAIDTPHISKSTPEGARDYLVPSRIQPGNFYALPQSPQQYKQLLMVAGLERYFQIARCFRDEDSRADRQPEFHQIDIEMSFTSQEEILQLFEQLYKDVIKEVFPEKVLTNTTFPRLTYQEAMDKYHSDRPDLRKDIANDDELAFVWVVDFPMFEWKERENRFDAMHHPFTAPASKYADNFEKKPKEAIAQQYDLVLNGVEVAGGSIRIHQSEMLERVFKFLGHSKEDIQTNFGHLLEAFQYGVPPHGGIASGFDRFVMILCKEKAIREVIAFPKAGDGRDLMMNAPCPVEEKQLKELGLKLIK